MNKKAPFKVTNPSKSKILGKDREIITLSSPDTHKFARAKQMGYENRLFYEWKLTDQLDGQTFFFTLTYCDEKVPKVHYGEHTFSTFDYYDIIWLLNGGFKKKLLREYGTNFKYFVSCELGEGKGERGFANNPHYHVMFFLRPDTSKSAKPYKKIAPEEFRSLIRLYWQGFDEDIDKRNGVFHRYEKSFKGIVKEGKYGIKVNSFRACIYVAKYVTKCQESIDREKIVENELRKMYKAFVHYDDLDNLKSFLDTYHPEWKQGKYSFYNHDLKFDIDMIVDDLQVKDEYVKYLDNLVESLVGIDLQEYRNRYGSKVRISQGVGDLALKNLQFIGINPTIPVETKNGIVNRPINLYYYRKLYTQLIPGIDGKPTRILNEKGIEYKCKKLDSQIKLLAIETKSKVESLDKTLYEYMRNSDVNTFSNLMSFDCFKTCYQGLNDKDEIFKRYAEYKLVYSDRFTKFYFDERTGIVEFPCINVPADFRRFVRPSILENQFNCMSADYLCSPNCENFISYMAHPYFRGYLCLFDVFSLITDYLFVKTDDKKESDWKRLQRTKKFHSDLVLKEFFSNLI